MLGLALNELFVPLLQRAFPEIIDFYLPPKPAATAWPWSVSKRPTRATRGA